MTAMKSDTWRSGRAWQERTLVPDRCDGHRWDGQAEWPPVIIGV
ncbi:hypothetical protein [Streptomyces sp. Ru87]|nr:hypothetical protein [Streptomyces sp. Ru87]